MKPKIPQVASDKVQSRDCFQTPDYATRLLIPFIPGGIETIWEPACGQGKICDVLELAGYRVAGSDLANGFDFFETCPWGTDAIITNPPFSLKQKFYDRCRSFNTPFALLIPADYSAWIIQAVRDGAEKIIPTRRIDYITPNGNQGKTSCSQFHSMWLTWGFRIGTSETFADLSLEQKRNDI